MLGRVVDLEDHRYLRIKVFDAQSGEIALSIKTQSIGSTGEWLFHEKEWFHAAIVVSPRMAELGPAFISILYLREMATPLPAPRDVSRICVEIVLIWDWAAVSCQL